jgi:hypothetical protein
MQPVTLTHPSSVWTRRNIHNGAMCTTGRRAPVSLETRLKTPNPTCFHVKQAARSRRLLSVLWRNQQTVAHLVLMPTPKNRHGDFEA